MANDSPGMEHSGYFLEVFPAESCYFFIAAPWSQEVRDPLLYDNTRLMLSIQEWLDSFHVQRAELWGTGALKAIPRTLAVFPPGMYFRNERKAMEHR